MDSVMAIMRSFYDKMDESLDRAKSSGKLTPACEGAGCNFCCHERVEILPAEAHSIFMLVREMPASVKRSIRANIAKYRAAVPTHLRESRFLLGDLQNDQDTMTSLSQTQMRKLEQRADKIGKLHLIASLKSSAPCPLLVDGKCSVYEMRPMTCRGWHSSDKSACSNPARTDDVILRPTLGPFYGLMRQMGLLVFPIVPLLEALEGSAKPMEQLSTHF